MKFALFLFLFTGAVSAPLTSVAITPLVECDTGGAPLSASGTGSASVSGFCDTGMGGINYGAEATAGDRSLAATVWHWTPESFPAEGDVLASFTVLLTVQSAYAGTAYLDLFITRSGWLANHAEARSSVESFWGGLAVPIDVWQQSFADTVTHRIAITTNTPLEFSASLRLRTEDHSVSSTLTESLTGYQMYAGDGTTPIAGTLLWVSGEAGRSALITSTPEPGTVGIVTVGLLALMARFARRSRLH